MAVYDDPAAPRVTPAQTFEEGLQERARVEFFTAGEDPRVVELREAVQALAVLIYKHAGGGRCANVALTHLTDTQMWANRGIFTRDPRK